MPADNANRLAQSARQRHELTRSKAVRALRELDQAGTAVNFEVVARNADLSRSWLYTQPDIRAEIERLREATRHNPAPAIPAAQRTSDASLLIRLQAANENNRLLVQENQRLRRQLAHALGDQRTSRERPSGRVGPVEQHRASALIHRLDFLASFSSRSAAHSEHGKGRPAGLPGLSGFGFLGRALSGWWSGGLGRAGWATGGVEQVLPGVGPGPVEG
jgi:hypothetical protein